MGDAELAVIMQLTIVVLASPGSHSEWWTEAQLELTDAIDELLRSICRSSVASGHSDVLHFKTPGADTPCHLNCTRSWAPLYRTANAAVHSDVVAML